MGLIEQGDAVFAYALNIDGPDFAATRDRRLELVRACFAALRLMPDSEE